MCMCVLCCDAVRACVYVCTVRILRLKVSQYSAGLELSLDQLELSSSCGARAEQPKPSPVQIAMRTVMKDVIYVVGDWRATCRPEDNLELSKRWDQGPKAHRLGE